MDDAYEDRRRSDAKRRSYRSYVPTLTTDTNCNKTVDWAGMAALAGAWSCSAAALTQVLRRRRNSSKAGCVVVAVLVTAVPTLVIFLTWSSLNSDYCVR
jgi:hypothetical protein